MKKKFNFKKFAYRLICCVVLASLLCSFVVAHAYTGEDKPFDSSNINYRSSNIPKLSPSGSTHDFYRRYVDIYNWYIDDSTNTSYQQSFGTTYLPVATSQGSVSDSIVESWFSDVFSLAGAPSDVLSYSLIKPLLVCYFDPNTRNTVFNIIHFNKNNHIYSYGIQEGTISSTGKYYQYFYANNSNPSDTTGLIYQVTVPENWNGLASRLTYRQSNNPNDVLFAYQNILIASQNFIDFIDFRLGVSDSASNMPNLYYNNHFSDIAYVFLDGPTKTITGADFSSGTFPLAINDLDSNDLWYCNLIICTYDYVLPSMLQEWLLKSNFMVFDSSDITINSYTVMGNPSFITSAGGIGLTQYKVSMHFTYTPIPGNHSYRILKTNYYKSVQYGCITPWNVASNGYPLLFDKDRVNGGISDNIKVHWDNLQSGFNFLQYLVNRVYLILPPEIYSMFVTMFTVIILLAGIRLVIT